MSQLERFFFFCPLETCDYSLQIKGNIKHLAFCRFMTQTTLVPAGRKCVGLLSFIQTLVTSSVFSVSFILFKYSERNTAKKKKKNCSVKKYRSWNSVLDSEQQSTDLITDSFHYTYSLFIMQPVDDSAQLETVTGKRCECWILKQMR